VREREIEKEMEREREAEGAAFLSFVERESECEKVSE
jgi:hypothetical protein